jgi:aminopeptidase N
MKTKFCSIILLLFLSNLFFAQSVDVQHLSLNLKFDWQKRQKMGVAEITLLPTTATNTIYLDAGMLTINAVLLNQKSLKYNYDGGDTSHNLEIVLDRTYNPNETIVLKIDYHTNYENKADPNSIWGSFGKGIRFQEPTSTTPNKRKQIWSSGEPENNKYWFPCNEAIADIHTLDFFATIEKPLMVISNGNLVETIENNDNTRTFHYKTDKAFPNYLVSFVVGEYIDALQNADGVPIHNFGYPHEKEAVKATTELLPNMMRFLEEKTNYKYPYPQYGQVVVQDYPFPGLNGQNGVATMSDNYIDDFGVHQDFKYLWDGVAVQALASQWFGNLIMPKSWEDIWLNNAFTEYFSGLYTEKNNTKTEYLTYVLAFEKSNVISDWNSDNKHPIVTNKYKDLASFTSDNYSKYRGAMILRMLQKEVGDENWWKALQLYVKTNAYKQVTTADFQKAIETTTGKSYQWFFDQWIYKIGLPKFLITKHFDDSKKALTINVKQTQTSDGKSEFEQVAFFEGKIDIEIDTKIEQVTIEQKAENNFIFLMSKAPKFVNFNFEETWICETEFKKSTEEYLEQLANSKDAIAKQIALDKLVEISNNATTTSDLKQKIVTAFKTEITSKSYWRYRVYALVSLRKIIALPYDSNTITMLLKLIKTETSWLKTSAIFSLGNTKDPRHTDIYIAALNDKSDRVINAAAIALGKTKSPKAYDALINLNNKPSWKSQSKISALNGLEQLGDVKAVDFTLKCLADNQSPRWYLATPVWDYPFAAANTLVAFGKAELGFPVLLERFKKSLNDNDLNDIFQNVQLIALLKDERAKEIYKILKLKFKDDSNTLEAVKNYESQFLESIKK